MRTAKRFVSVILSLAVVLSVCAVYSRAASSKITGLKILTLPTKTIFYENEDWVYGTWDSSEAVPGEYVLIPSKKISFTHNPCSGLYTERGMLDMRGLTVEVSYSNGTKETIAYKETLRSGGFYNANIYVSPKDGTEYFIGANTMEVYLPGNPACYDSYDVDILAEKDNPNGFRMKNPDKITVDADGYITGIRPWLTEEKLKADYFDFGTTEVIFSKSVRTSRYYGTGSIVTVKYQSGIEKKYELIIPGDIDGNGIINNSDVIIMSKVVGDNSILSGAYLKAAELNRMPRINGGDLSVLMKMAAGCYDDYFDRFY